MIYLLTNFLKSEEQKIVQVMHSITIAMKVCLIMINLHFWFDSYYFSKIINIPNVGYFLAFVKLKMMNLNSDSMHKN